MKDLIELGRLFKNNPKVTVATVAAMVAGAFTGAMAFYNGWLG